MIKVKVDDSDHLMRYVPYSQQVRDAESDEFLGIANVAFSIRASDQGGLSTTWVEHYGIKSHDTVRTAAYAFRDSLPSKKIASKAYFAIGQAGATIAAALNFDKKIRLVVAPDGSNTGHVEIHRFDDSDRALLDTLAQDVFIEHVAVADL